MLGESRANMLVCKIIWVLHFDVTDVETTETNDGIALVYRSYLNLCEYKIMQIRQFWRF